jgi:putative SOS response-associated peptidase YedK
MCGRFVAASKPEEIAAYFGAEAPEVELPANWNVAPTNDVYGVVEGPDGVLRVEVFHWGLVPSWAKDVKLGQRMINARADTLAMKNAYKSAFKKHRCIIPMDGFYEWKQLSGPDAPLTRSGKPAKQPVYAHRLDGEPLAVAGLWSPWRDPQAGDDAPWLHSLTVVTTDANGTMAPIHDRMPVILPPSAWKEWLDRENQDVAALTGLLVPAPDDLLGLHAVSTDVNNVRNKGPQLVEPVEGVDLGA